MRIEVLGTGCAKCESLAENARAAAEKLGIEYELFKVTDLVEIASRGVMMTPALSIDGIVKVSGNVPDANVIMVLLKEKTQ